MFRRNFIGAAVAAACFSALPVQAQQIIKATDVHPLGYPTVEALVRMGNKLEKATNGKYKMQMFPSMQLGGEKEMIEQAQVGALQIARISVGPMGPIVDELNVFNMPFVFKDEAQMRKVIDGPIGEEMLDQALQQLGEADRARLDGRRHAQRLLRQAGDQARRPERA